MSILLQNAPTINMRMTAIIEAQTRPEQRLTDSFIMKINLFEGI